MKSLTYATIGAERPALVERIMQFGEGVFLRAFCDDLIDDLNKKGVFDGGIVVVQPLPVGRVDALNAQDGLYTLLLRGLEDGQKVERTKLIQSITRGIDPYSEYDAYRAVIESPELRFVISNTTEAGIAYSANDRVTDAPPASFPGKVTQLLHLRFKALSGAPDKGLVFIPCELIDDNGKALHDIVIRLAHEWQLGDAFINWVETCCTFTTTLVDRIVTGYPKAEAEQLWANLGYRDDMLDTGEVFSLFVIAGPDSLGHEIPFDKAELNVLLTDDVTPYKRRKVRILNGAHTTLIPVALLCGHETVGESISDPLLNRYVRRILFDEIIPSIDMDITSLTQFADTVFDRFKNPFIRHMLAGIALNSTSKWKARVLPSLEASLANTGELPKLITFSFAATLELMHQGRDDIKDSDNIDELYGELNRIIGFADMVEAFRASIRENGCRAALKAIL